MGCRNCAAPFSLQQLFGFYFSVIPSLVQQISSLASNMPDFIKQVESWLKEVAELPLFKEVDINKYFEQLDISYGTIIQQFLSGVSNSLGSIVGTIASATVVIITAPFILFYMLKDGEKLVPNIQQFFPEKRRNQTSEHHLHDDRRPYHPSYVLLWWQPHPDSQYGSYSQ